MKTIFGPVPSRRLGRSLGIDVIPAKTCTYDCVYCESGRTTRLSLKREAFVAPEQVLKDLDDYFRAHPQGADVLTFSSAGEPTLYEPLGDLLKDIRKRFKSFPLVVLTNGSMLWDPKVRRDLMVADRLIPSLDAVTQETFTKLNRPHPALELSVILEGLEALRREYRGELCIEVMLVSGYNDHPDEWKAIRRVIDRLNPDQVELNTVVRPPAYLGTCGLTSSRMEEALSFFPREKTQIIGHFRGSYEPGSDSTLAERIIEMVHRRPCKADEMAASLSASSPKELTKTLHRLEREGKLIRFSSEHGEYFCTRSSKRTACRGQ
jgi:wyosine [tRNA(Phe)-imidazoG37] synthetase (radical SAM superfamily)